MCRTTMKEVRRARYLVLEGWTAKEVSKEIGMSYSQVLSYTKAERAKMKKRLN